GACAVASVVQTATINPKLPAAMQILRSFDFMVLIFRPALLVRSFLYIFSFYAPKVPGGLELVGSPTHTESYHLEVSGTVGLHVDCDAWPPSRQPSTNRRSARQKRQRTQLTKFCRPLPITIGARRQNRQEPYAR